MTAILLLPMQADETPSVENRIVRLPPFVVTESLARPRGGAAIKIHPDKSGQVIVELYRFHKLAKGSWQAKLGLKEDDLLLKINGQPVPGMRWAHFQELAQTASGKMTFEIQSKDSATSRVIELDYEPDKSLTVGK